MNDKLEKMIKNAEEKSLLNFLLKLEREIESYDDEKDVHNYDYFCGARDILNLIIDKIKK